LIVYKVLHNFINMELLIERSGHRLVILDQKEGFLKKQNLAMGDKSKKSNAL
jgi:hypothetical protein